MDFEKAYGSQDLCEKVKEMALQYVETSMKTKSLTEENIKQNSNSIETNLKKTLLI